MTDKQIAAEAVARLPETASLREIADELDVMIAIRQGQADAAAGRVRPHEEVKELFASWTERWTKNPSSC